MSQKKEKKYYEQIKDWDFKKFEIKTDYLTNWDMYQILRNVTDDNSRVLDLGTGGGEKVIEEYPDYLKEVVGVDFSDDMIKTANENLKKSNKQNISFKVMNNLHLNFEKSYFDVVVARHTITDPNEIKKVLKPNGFVIIRGVDKYDCHELKMIFKKGQAYDDSKPISIIDYEGLVNAGFGDVELVPIHCREYFKDKDTLKAFLAKVPILDEFSEENDDSKEYYTDNIDEEKLDEYIKRNTTEKGIRLIRRYYGITAKKSL